MLAEIPGFGRIFDCGACGNLHLSVGPVSVTLSADAYMQLVALLNTSAANFELWMRGNRAEISEHGGASAAEGDL
jgi:hypothetical protein